MPKSKIQKFIAHKPLGEVTEYSITTPAQSQYLRQHTPTPPTPKKMVVHQRPESSKAVQDTARLQAKINEMRTKSPQTNFSSTGNDTASTTASIQQHINHLNR
ncbi:MAG: hypothetical protein QG675_383 [Patescibacteria group bacterium]|jgi:hypothetical protein|nr:hypothetical protein [Patescibacteria group bacterium]